MTGSACTASTPHQAADPRRSGPSWRGDCPDAFSHRTPSTPWPAVSLTDKQRRSVPDSVGACARTSERDAGCRECWAKAHATASAACASTPSRQWVATKARLSPVKVPVLSNTKVSTRASASMAPSLRTSTPARASAPAAASMAVGVARDRAQGQVTTKMATAVITPRCGSTVHHHAPAPAASSKTMSKKGRAMRSASAAISGLVVEAATMSAAISA